ncbi:MAG TPA: AAA family ATPase [Solirubrobacterales bacterium]|nr:AAA family ATPase [Solirubrobacterales bacterium]
MSAIAAVESAVEQQVWNLLIRNINWEPPEELGIQISDRADSEKKPPRLQIFELAVAATFASLCPDYEWHVTPNLAGDGGVDFIGRHDFLKHEGYGIAAAVTVGGQCKKRQGNVGNIVTEISGSLVDMVTTLDPTFFVVALSSHLDKKRVEEARAKVERAYSRHCHILDRPQLEGLFSEKLAILTRILDESRTAGGGLTAEEAGVIRRYFEDRIASHSSSISVQVATPDNALAGIPFTAAVEVRSTALATSRLHWRPSQANRSPSAALTLIEPGNAEMESGAELLPQMPSDNPLLGRCRLELRTHAVGDVDLGEIQVGPAEQAPSADAWIALGTVRVVENMRPRFFEPPFRGQLKRLAEEYRQALAGGVASVGVVGAGGSGKSRLCEEFALERRRRGCDVVTAKQAKTLDDPHRLLADLFIGLVDKDISYESPADSIIEEIGRFDAALAERAGPAIRSIFAMEVECSGIVNDQSVLSALLLLIVARARQAPVVIHLQDLHWSTTDLLLLLATLVWQLGHALAAAPGASRGILFLFEGRIREQQGIGDDGWDSMPFEVFLEKLDCSRIVCSSLDPKHSREFVHRLFEERNPGRAGADDLLLLQRELVDQIDKTAGGNPFHSLEQVQLLKERGVIGQNLQSGLLYPIRPDPSGLALPSSVFASIQLRWRYMKERMPELALLVWALALLEDRIPTPLFRRLWRELAPDVSLADLDGTDLLWTGEGQEREVLFRHENYFRSLRRFEVSVEDRDRTVDVYSRWFEEMDKLDPNDQFRWARVLMERQRADVASVERLLTSAGEGAEQRGDLRLARRISASSLDFAWAQDDRFPIEADAFLERCDEELALVRHLLVSDRPRADQRIAAVRARMEQRLAAGPVGAVSAEELRWRILTADLLESQHLFMDNRPAQAAEIAASTARQVETSKPASSEDSNGKWTLLEMEALHSHAVALALSGEDTRALGVSQRAVGIAERHPSALASHVVCTYAAILLTADPAEAESVLRACLTDLDDTPALAVVREEVELTLTEALILLSYGDTTDDGSASMMSEARSLSYRVFRKGFELGKYSDAGAAALLMGILSALEGDAAEVSWFAQAVAASSRGRHTETLWRAHIDLAVALYRKGAPIGEGVRDHALAAVEIMEETLTYYAEPDESQRFDLLRSPLSQAARYLLLAGDETGPALLERYPKLRLSFEDLDSRVLRPDRGATSTYKWLRVESEDYILY